MRITELHLKTLKTVPKDENSINASLLIRANYIEKLSSGVYNFLPLGLLVLNKITNIVREEMNSLGGKEILMAALQPKQNWEQTGRWQSLSALFKVKSQYDIDYALGPTHEEIVTPLAKRYIVSYKDLPLYLYQIQTKFRDEPRPKSGLLRTREFLMKDLYSFHKDENDLDLYYEKVKRGYFKIFKRLNLEAILVEASGGTFSKFSHEFQVITPSGEDNIYYCPHCGFARNEEIIGDLKKCPYCGHELEKVRGIEVGNIFKLKDKYSKPFDLKFIDKDGFEKIVMMGCYGIGISRILGALVETHYDEKGIIWPESIAPFKFYLLPLFSGKKTKDYKIKKEAENIYQKLIKNKIEILYDDRKDVSSGEKLQDADLLGIPYRIVISNNTLDKNSVELKKRSDKKSQLITLRTAEKIIKNLNEKSK
jgi:prolyl-tRNA synthetase